jgi:hypothetical protein
MTADDHLEFARAIAEADHAVFQPLATIDEVQHSRQPGDLRPIDVGPLLPIDEQEPTAVDQKVSARHLRHPAV